MSHRYLIIGQGLAGTCLAWQLHFRGIPFLIVDPDEPQTSSKVAAGLVTPVTGMRLNLNWKFGELQPEALAFYRKIEQLIGETFYHEAPVVRLLRDEKAAALWEQRRQQPEIQPYLADSQNPLVDEAVFENPYGGFEQRSSGWMDTALFLRVSRSFFESQGSWIKGRVNEDALDFSGDGVRWEGKSFSQAVHCIGWAAAQTKWFDWVPFQSALGSVLNLKVDTGGEKRIINRGCWLLPRADGSLRAGPTYELSFKEGSTPSPEVLAKLEEKLQRLLKRPYQVEGCQTGVRPIIKGRHVLLGRHPAWPQLAVFNGLGSKGVLRAPWASRMLVQHLLDGEVLEPALDVRANG